MFVQLVDYVYVRGGVDRWILDIVWADPSQPSYQPPRLNFLQAVWLCGSTWSIPNWTIGSLIEL